ncbi:MAG: hypothetical protein JSS45_09840 [Proteobacteria bacterium]|nr:hypothetical protein [Pseudomonadota bacterium]
MPLSRLYIAYRCVVLSLNLRKIRVLLLMGLLLYSVIPTESGDESSALLIRAIAAWLLSAAILIGGVSKRGIVEYGPTFAILYAPILIGAFISFSLRYFIASLAFVLCYLWVLAISSNGRLSDQLISALVGLMWLSCGVLIIQVAGFASGVFIPFHSIFFPWSEARIQVVDGVSRLGGLYIEPGTFANWMYAFFVLHVLATGRVAMRLGIAAAVCVMLSISAWGVVVGALMLMFTIFFSTNRASIRENIHGSGAGIGKRLVLLFCAILFLRYFLSDEVREFLLTKFSFQTHSGETKLEVYQYLTDHWTSLLFLGRGFDPDFCTDCEHVADSGAFIGVAMVYGFPVAIAFFGVILRAAYRARGLAFMLLAIPLLTTKLPYWDFVLFLIFGTAVMVNHRPSTHRAGTGS